MSDPVSGAVIGAVSKPLASLLITQLQKLAKGPYNRRLVRRIFEHLDKRDHRPDWLERRRLRQLLRSESSWASLIEASVRSSRDLTESIFGVLSSRRSIEERRAMASEVAVLAVTQLPGSLDLDDSFDLVVHEIRNVLHESRDHRAMTDYMVRVLEEVRSQLALPLHMSADVAEYRRSLSHALRRRRPEHCFRITLSYRDLASQPEDALVTYVARNSRTAICALAGSGKSVLLQQTASELNQHDGHLVVYIDLKSWVSGTPVAETPRATAGEVTIDALLEASITPVTLQFIQRARDSLPADVREIWLIDGVNELSSDLSGRVLAAAIAHIRRTIRSSLVVTDRSDTRYPDPEWAVVHVEPLAQAEVDRHLPVEGSAPAGSPGRRDLLRTPFFLDVAIRDKGSAWKTSTQAIRSLFAERLRLSAEQIDRLAEFAFNVNLRSGGLPFGVGSLAAAVGTDEAERLVRSMVVEPKQDSSVAFYHQLLHDYLASRWVARNSELWVPRAFDALSFDANAFEATLMVLDQLVSDDDVSRYLTALYDWNWFLTVRCVVHALRAGWSVPSHLNLIISAMLAEKRFDPVRRSRERADEFSRHLDEAAGRGFAQARELPDVTAEVRSAIRNSFPSWVAVWHSLFDHIQDPNYVPTEAEVTQLSSPNTFIGWTTATILRRCRPDAAALRQARAIYTGALNGADDTSRSVRWRVVHALGPHPSQENSELLLQAIDNDRYSWVIYGAVRSLLEMAALAREGARTGLMSEVAARLHALRPEALAQVAAATLYDGAPASWEDLVMPLLLRARELQDDDEGRARWDRYMEAFRIWSSRRTP